MLVAAVSVTMVKLVGLELLVAPEGAEMVAQLLLPQLMELQTQAVAVAAALLPQLTQAVVVLVL
jgi:hypothetical protein